MKLSEAMERAQALKPDVYTEEQMTGWLSDLDGKLSLDVFHTAPVPYSFPADAEEKLLVPAPYDNLYPLLIVAMEDFHNRDTDAYQNDMVMFNEAVQAFRMNYLRDHTPIDTGGWKM